jgi:hypothetical protein
VDGPAVLQVLWNTTLRDRDSNWAGGYVTAVVTPSAGDLIRRHGSRMSDRLYPLTSSE